MISVSLGMTVKRENLHSAANRENSVFKVCMDPEVLTEFPDEEVQRAKKVTLER